MVEISQGEPIYGDIQEHARRMLDNPDVVMASYRDGSGGSHELVHNQRPLGQVRRESLEDLDPLSKRALLWREEGFDPDRMRSIMLDENRFEWHLRGMQDLPRFPHNETWGAREAALMHELMIPYFADERASFLFNVVKWAPDLMIHRWLESINETEGSDLSLTDVHTARSAPEMTLWTLYPSTVDLAADLGRRWASNEFLLSLADTAFVDLLHSMTESAPQEPIHPDELITTDGVLFFRQPILRDSLVGEDDEPTPIRGISWFSDDERLHVMLLSDAGDHWYTDGYVDDHVRPYLRMVTMSEIEFDENIEDIESQTLANLMRSLLHLLQSPIVNSERIQRRPKKARRRNKRRAQRDIDITCLSLRPIEQPSHRAEATNTADAHAKRHMRRHMARGHWRNQWYPSSHKHRVIWIDGHWRGNADIGLINGKTVYIARGD